MKLTQADRRHLSLLIVLATTFSRVVLIESDPLDFLVFDR